VGQGYWRLALHNLRLSFFVIVAAAGAVAAYAIFAGAEVDWSIVVFVAMVLSSLINALIDIRRERAEPPEPK
jgi:uncharacterized membrane protein